MGRVGFLCVYISEVGGGALCMLNIVDILHHSDSSPEMSWGCVLKAWH